MNIVLPSNGLAAYAISVELKQQGSLKINDVSAMVATWASGGLGTIEVPYVSDTVRKYVRDYIDRFINAYLSVNPRPLGTATPSSTSPRRNLVR